MTKANNFFGSHNGTENYYQHQFGIKYTDGVHELAESCQAYWLIDLIASHQCKEEVKRESFQVWQLLRSKDSIFDIICTDGNNHIVACQQIPYSDFPYDEAILWHVDGITLLPNEY